MTPGRRLRNLIAGASTEIVPGAANPLAARILEDIGFLAVYATGAGIANSGFARPDLGLVTMTEMADQVRRICDAVSVPVIADADTGFGGTLNVARTVQEYERAGVAAVQLEDQIHPKRCGHFDGTVVVSVAEMLQRLEAARRARSDPDLVIVARTDARASLGLEEAIRRANLYHEAGADVLFVEAPHSLQELAEVGRRIEAPLVANMVEDGRTPVVPLHELQTMGFSLALYANTALRLSMHAMQSGMKVLRETGSSESIAAMITPWEERQRLVGLPAYLELEAKIATAAGDGDGETVRKLSRQTSSTALAGASARSEEGLDSHITSKRNGARELDSKQDRLARHTPDSTTSTEQYEG